MLFSCQLIPQILVQKNCCEAAAKRVRCQNKSVPRIMMHLKGIASRIFQVTIFPKVLHSCINIRTPPPPPQFGIPCVPKKLHIIFQQSSCISISRNTYTHNLSNVVYELQTSTEVIRVTKLIISQMLKDNKKLWARNLIGSEKIHFKYLTSRNIQVLIHFSEFSHQVELLDKTLTDGWAEP